MKLFLTLALLVSSTMSSANSINALIVNDAVVKGVLTSIQNKHKSKCSALDVKVEKTGAFTANTTCLNIGDEFGALIEIKGTIYGDAKDAAVMVENIKIGYAG